MDGATVSLAEYVKAQLGFNPSTADVIDYVREHPEEIGSALVPNANEGKPDMPDALIGGEGNDVMYGQGGNDLLIGDGSNTSGADDTLHRLAQELGTLTGGSHGVTPASLSDAILNLGHDSAKLHELADWSEKHLENSSDGDDWLFGGEGTMSSSVWAAMTTCTAALETTSFSAAAATIIYTEVPGTTSFLAAAEMITSTVERDGIYCSAAPGTTSSSTTPPTSLWTAATASTS